MIERYVGWNIDSGFVIATAKSEDVAKLLIEGNQDAVFLGTLEEIMENMERFLKEADKLRQFSKEVKDLSQKEQISRGLVEGFLESHLSSLPLDTELLDKLVKEHEGTTHDYWRGYFEGVTFGYKKVLGEE